MYVANLGFLLGSYFVCIVFTLYMLVCHFGTFAINSQRNTGTTAPGVCFDVGSRCERPRTGGAQKAQQQKSNQYIMFLFVNRLASVAASLGGNIASNVSLCFPRRFRTSPSECEATHRSSGECNHCCRRLHLSVTQCVLATFSFNPVAVPI